MVIAARVVGTLACLFGAIWLLQGLNVLPGSAMSGQTLWVVIGAVMLFFGAGLIYLSPGLRRR